MESEEISRKLPVNFDEKDVNLFAHELKLLLYPVKVFTLKNVLLDSRGYIFKYFKVSTQSYLYGNPYYRFKYPRLVLQLLLNKRKIVKRKGIVIWVTNHMSVNYFHWMCDVLPRIILLQKDALTITDYQLALPVECKGSDFIKESLSIIGLNDVVFIDTRELLSVERLLTISEIAITGNYDPKPMLILRDKVHNFIQQKNSLSGLPIERIYISRKLATKRKVHNEDAVETLVKAYGYTVFYFEQLSFLEQLEIITKSRYLVSIHGAGLTNMLFMKHDSSILEFRFIGDSHNNCYFSLASALNHNYYYQLCSPWNDNDPHTSNLIVDTEILEKNLNLIHS